MVQTQFYSYPSFNSTVFLYINIIELIVKFKLGKTNRNLGRLVFGEMN